MLAGGPASAASWSICTYSLVQCMVDRYKAYALGHRAEEEGVTRVKCDGHRDRPRDAEVRQSQRYGHGADDVEHHVASFGIVAHRVARGVPRFPRHRN